MHTTISFCMYTNSYLVYLIFKRCVSSDFIGIIPTRIFNSDVVISKNNTAIQWIYFPNRPTALEPFHWITVVGIMIAERIKRCFTWQYHILILLVESFIYHLVLWINYKTTMNIILLTTTYYGNQYLHLILDILISGVYIFLSKAVSRFPSFVQHVDRNMLDHWGPLHLMWSFLLFIYWLY